MFLPELEKAFSERKAKEIYCDISSANRSTGTITGSVITEKFGEALADDTYIINCTGGGGQSFGAFIPKGLTLKLTGDSNDYFGKGLSGGRLIVRVNPNSSFEAEKNVIIGNVALYGATGGTAFINGIAGERFCVRNSGAVAVAEGCGDHGCEYMTGGRVAILGTTGKNFAAGMSGGVAYVLDSKHDFYLRLNKEMVIMSAVTEPQDIAELKDMIAMHTKFTGSVLGQKILDNMEGYLPLFKKIIPCDYQKMMQEIALYEGKGMSEDEARLQAFLSLSNRR